MIDDATDLCPDDRLADAVAAIADPAADGHADIAALSRTFPGDPRLHFLAGSLAAGTGDYDTARRWMARAVEVAPDYAIARFQYGLLLLTCGDVAEAEAALRPVPGIVPGDPLADFASGLLLLMQDAFAPAAAALERGLAARGDNAALHADMAMLLGEIRARAEPADAPPAGGSAAQLLLQQAALKATMH